MSVIYISQIKYEELLKKLKHLKEEVFPENRKIMRTAIEQGGGMHDNAGYEHAEANERLLLKRITELEELISKAKIIKNNEIDTSAVRLGTQVKIEDLDTGLEKIYIITGAYETDVEKNHISYLSPLARGLIGKKVGDIVEIKLPKKILCYKIISIDKAHNW